MSKKDEAIRQLVMLNQPTKKVNCIKICNAGKEYYFKIRWCYLSKIFVAEHQNLDSSEVLTLLHDEYLHLRQQLDTQYKVTVLTSVCFLTDISVGDTTYLFVLQWYPPAKGIRAAYCGDTKQPDLITSVDITRIIATTLRNIYSVVVIERIYFTREFYLDDLLVRFAFGWHKDSSTRVARYIGPRGKNLYLTRHAYNKLRLYLLNKMGTRRTEKVICAEEHATVQAILAKTITLVRK